jgi:hypothetical protein
MLTKVIIERLKRFERVEIPLGEAVVFAGPNNFGKTTAIQALSLWKFALDRWQSQRGRGTKSKAKKRVGVSITRKELTAIPVRSFELLWNNKKLISKQPKDNTPIKIIITVEGRDNGRTWSCGIELQYARTDLIYCRLSGEEEIPPEALQYSMIHVPPLSGLQTEEKRIDPGYQNYVIGEGRPGEFLRTLLWEIAEQTDQAPWQSLCEHIKTIFRYQLLKPSYVPARDAFIMAEYLPGIPPSSRGKGGLPVLDISSGGSGFHQVLLLLAFFYARPGSVLLLDEPDAHLHVILQHEIFDLLRKVAWERKSQLVVATHSEVIIDETDPTQIVAFLGEKPHPLLNTSQKAKLQKALTRLRSLDYLLAGEIGRVLFSEGENDCKILREWARILSHPAYTFLSHPYFVSLGGNDWTQARDHFHALKEAFPDLQGYLLLDRREPFQGMEDLIKSGLAVGIWERNEIENYLLIPEAIVRFCRSNEPGMFASHFESAAREMLQKEWPPAALEDSFGKIAFLTDLKASDEILLPFFQKIGKPTNKSELYLLTAEMKPEEIHPEVITKLDAIAEAFHLK